MERYNLGKVWYLVSLDLVFVADKSYVEEIFLLPELSECNADVGFEVRPSQTKLLICHLQISLLFWAGLWNTFTETLKRSPEKIYDDLTIQVLFRDIQIYIVLITVHVPDVLFKAWNSRKYFLTKLTLGLAMVGRSMFPKGPLAGVPLQALFALVRLGMPTCWSIVWVTIVWVWSSLERLIVWQTIHYFKTKEHRQVVCSNHLSSNQEALLYDLKIGFPEPYCANSHWSNHYDGY